MGKQIVKVKHKRSLKVSGLLGLMATISLFLLLYTSLFTKQGNANLSRQIQDTQRDIKLVRDETESLTAELDALRNYNRVVGFASDAGLDLHADSTVTVKPGE